MTVVLVWPSVNPHASVMPANRRIGLVTSPTASPTPCGRRAEGDDDRARAARDLERHGVRAAAAALPASASAEHLDDRELRAVDRAADRRSDLPALGPAEADVAVAVADDDRHGELEAATGVGHPLDHVDVEDLVVEHREERVDDLRLPQRQPAAERVRSSWRSPRTGPFGRARSSGPRRGAGAGPPHSGPRPAQGGIAGALTSPPERGRRGRAVPV